MVKFSSFRVWEFKIKGNKVFSITISDKKYKLTPLNVLKYDKEHEVMFTPDYPYCITVEGHGRNKKDVRTLCKGEPFLYLFKTEKIRNVAI